MLDPQLQQRAESGDPQAQLQLGVALMEQGRAGSDAFEQGVAWLERAAQRDPAAQLMLGHAFAQAHQLEGAYERAVDHYRRATGAPPPHGLEAMARLADLSMVGLGLERNDAEALAHYRRIAGHYQADALVDVAYLLRHGVGCEADAEQSVTWLLHAVAQGSPRAYLALGVCFRDGIGVAPDLALASALFSNAAKGGYPLAEELRHECWPQLSAEDKDRGWELTDTLTRNRQTLGDVLRNQVDEAAVHSGDAEVFARLRQLTDAHFATLDLPALSLDPAVRREQGEPVTHAAVKPARPVVVGWRPRVFSIDDFITDEERAHLMTIGQANMLTSEQTESASHLTERDAFNGDSAIIVLPLCDPITRVLQRRIAEAVMIPPEHHEPLSVLRYRRGHEYAPHVDYFTEEREALNASRSDRGGQRVVTFLVHLVSPITGGETEYVRAGLRIQGKPRRASIHFNTLPSGEADRLSLHAGLPIVSGEKWICRTAIRANPLYHQAASDDDVRLRGDGLEDR